jgi:hypothetical protein
MVIKSITDKVLLADKRDVIRLHLYFKLLQYDVKALDNDIDIMIELYMFGGYKTPEEQYKFIGLCMDKKLKKSDQSLRNTLSKYVRLKVFDKPKNSTLSVNEKYIPSLECDKLVLSYTISHAK